MNYQLYELEPQKALSIEKYLIRDSTEDGETIIMGINSLKMEIQKYFLHGDFGIKMNRNNLIIFHKDFESIGKEFSRLEKLSGKKDGNKI